MRSFIIAIIICDFRGSKGICPDVKLEVSAPSVVGVGEQFKLIYKLSKRGEKYEITLL